MDSNNIFSNNFKKEYGNIVPVYLIKHENQLNKGKIHCSCYICRMHEKKKSELNKINSMIDKLKQSKLDVQKINKMKNKLKKDKKVNLFKGCGMRGTTLSKEKENYKDYSQRIDLAYFRKGEK